MCAFPSATHAAAARHAAVTATATAISTIIDGASRFV